MHNSSNLKPKNRFPTLKNKFLLHTHYLKISFRRVFRNPILKKRFLLGAYMKNINSIFGAKVYFSRYWKKLLGIDHFLKQFYPIIHASFAFFSKIEILYHTYVTISLKNLQ